MNEHYEYDELPHLKEFQEVAPQGIEAMVWRSQFLTEHCLPSGVLLEPGAQLFVNMQRRMHRGTSFWLSKLIAGRHLDARKKLQYKHCEPFAQIEAAYWNLAIGLLEEDEAGFRKHDYIIANNALAIWEDMRLVDFTNLLHNSGFITGIPPKEKSRSKRARLDGDINHLKTLADDILVGEKSIVWVNWNESPPKDVKGLSLKWEDNPRLFLMETAAFIAQSDTAFEEIYWVPFQKVCRYWLRRMRDSDKHFVAKLLPNGSISIPEKKKKLEKYKTFGKK